MANDVVPFHKGEANTPADILRDAMASAQAGKVSALIIVALSDEGDVMTAWSGIDNGLFSLSGGLGYMQSKLARRIDENRAGE
jgi:hypothetical protein